MHRVETPELQPGMVLAEPVRGPRGDVLLGAGVELAERHLRGLKAWGIKAVVVEGEPPALQPAADATIELPPELLATARELVAARFVRAGTAHPLLVFLAEEALRRLAAEMKEMKQAPR